MPNDSFQVSAVSFQVNTQLGVFPDGCKLETMRVLSIDPGYGRCGVAVVEKGNGRENLLYSACIETSAKTDFSLRLGTIVRECEQIIKMHEPHALALERLYLTSNHKTAMKVAEVRGALIAIAAKAGIRVFEYTPSQVKSATASWGGANKTQMARMLHSLMKIKKTIKHDDEYDAIAIGVTHLACFRENSESA